jgi:hypothetical protein
MSDLIKNLEEYIKINGERSSGRLVFVLGSLIVFGVFIFNFSDPGVQNIVIAVLGYCSASITISKFSNQKPNESQPNK